VVGTLGWEPFCVFFCSSLKSIIETDVCERFDAVGGKFSEIPL